MTEESTTPDLVERVRRSIQAANDRDIDWALTFFAPDGVWDMSPWGMGTFVDPAHPNAACGPTV
jgi:hypothetical protein